MSLPLKRRYPFSKTQQQTSPQPASDKTSVPTFVSIFDTDMSGCSTQKDTQDFREQAPPVMTSLQHPTHKSQSSVSTSASSSTNSSPTTTVSTVESMSLEENSTPDSSPDSLGSLMALPSFRPRGGRLSADLTITPPSPGAPGGRPQSPSKRPRNTKNLSLNVPPSPAMLQPSKDNNDDSDRSKNSTPKSISAPSSPAFIVPPPPQNPRRRASNLGLTIKLPGPLSERKPGSLRHHQSSPSLFSPGPRAGPPGGMTFPQSASFRQTTFQIQRPSFNNRWASETVVSSGPSSAESNSPPKSPEVLQEMDEEDDDEPPRSGEAKSPAYPTGPALIFEPNIYLYAEPTAELASQFDVVINVAREVLNPFKVALRKESVTSPIPDTACTESSFKTAFEEAVFSPVSVKGNETPKPKLREPEYVHMPWEHNTPILDDLPALVELISERSNEGKKVLVHCQCGVSRSATLLIAYSMYKNPEKSMQDAYSAVKSKSRWIGPNMSLIYQLTDWKKMICQDPPKTAFGGWRTRPSTAGLRNGPSTGGFGGRGMPLGDDVDTLQEPQTAPLPERRTSPSVSPLMSPVEHGSEGHKPSVIRTRSENGGFITGISPGPSSAPPGMVSIPGSTTSTHNRQSWPDGDAKLCLPSTPRVPDSPQPNSWSKATSEPPEPSRAPPPPPPPAPAASLPGSTTYSLENSGPRIPGGFDQDMDDVQVPETPSIASPRNSGFWATMPTRRFSQWGHVFADPRSPTERGTTTPVLRNIFDVL